MYSVWLRPDDFLVTGKSFLLWSGARALDLLWSSYELTRLLFLLGAVAALIYKKRFGVTPGGIIVPGMLAIGTYASWLTPVFVIVNALVCVGIYQLCFARYALKHRWSALILVTLSTVIGFAAHALQEPAYNELHQVLLINLVAPGLVAMSIRRSGLVEVFAGTATVTAIVYVVGIAIYMAFPPVFYTQLTVGLSSYQELSIHHSEIFLVLSLIVSALVYVLFGIRGGGYIVAPYIAAVTLSTPAQGLLLLGSAVFCYGSVRLIQRYTLIVGLERFVLCLICATIAITANDIIAVTLRIDGYRPAQLILVIAIAIATNDLCLKPLKYSLVRGILPAQLIAHTAQFIVR